MIRNLIVAFSLSILVTACGKDDAKPADGDKPAPTAAKPVDGKPAPAAPAAAPAAAGAVTFTDNADYEAKGMKLMGSMIDVFASDGTDCAKLATDLTKFITDNKPSFAAFKAYEAAHPEAKKDMDAKAGEMMKSFEAKATPALTACKDNKDFQDAMKKMPE